ncbi:uncharacterized protein LOC127700667 isoform X1 [Mytilus californianus]|uniref:uncharacterized protein LOC127700667 isoform X1 n=1 Tax=Mytilus californianus TaxID=6549 RepID=UPI002245FB4F|nr:uncharacterized protein LOC127700667 isoform X1 [Mytilus californianus]
MYVLYKPVVKQGDSEVHKQNEQAQPSTSGIQLDLGPYNQPLDIRSQTVLQTQMSSGSSSSSQGQSFLQSQPFVQSIQSQGHLQHVIQGQQAVQGTSTYVQVGQQLFQVQPMATGQNLGHSLSTDINNANLSVKIGQISPLLNINSSDNPSQRQIITHIKSEPLSKQHENIPSTSEIENTCIKTEVLDPEYEQHDSANSTVGIASTNLYSGEVYPTGLVTNVCMLNDQSGKVSCANTDTKTHLHNKEQTQIDPNSKINWMDKALIHWKKWATSKQKHLASKGLTCTSFMELIKCIRSKKQLLELVFEFAFDLVDENGKTYSWDYMSKIISMLEEGSKEALRWIDVKMLYVAKTAYTARKKDIADEIIIKKLSEMKPQQKPALQQLKPILPKPNSSQSSCNSSEEGSAYTKDDLREKDLERDDLQANCENDESAGVQAMVSTIVTKSTSNKVLSCNVTSSSYFPSSLEKSNKKKRERDEETRSEASVKKIKKEPIEITDIEIYPKEKPGEITSDNTCTVIHANINENMTSAGGSENSLYTRVAMQSMIPTEILCQGPFCIENVTSLANEASDKVPVDRYNFLEGRDHCDINKAFAADNVDNTSASKNTAVSTDIEKINSSVPGNTLKNNNWANNTWNDWAKARNKINVDPNEKPVPLLHTVFKNVTEEELNELLIKFIYEVRNGAGAPYPPNSIRSLIAGFQRIFRRSGWTNLSLFDSTKKEFSKFHKALDDRCCELIKQGIGVSKKQAQMITDQQEQVLWEKGVFSLDMSWGLLYAVYFYTCKVFCVGPSYELWKLRVSQFAFGEDETGKYVQFTSRVTVSSKKIKPVKQYKCEDNPRTYYNMLEKYMLIIPKVNDIFWFRPSRDFSSLPISKSRLVFSRCPLGKNMLDNLISKMMKHAGYKGYYTNHSVKATMAAKMFKQGYQEEFIQERTGHSSTITVKKYNKGIHNAEAVRADISSTLDPPPPKQVKHSHLVNNGNKNVSVGSTQVRVVTLPKVPEKQSEHLQDLENQTKSYEDVQASSKISQQEIEILQREKDKQNKEILILKKTVDEMELRIETQKQTLSARDESMKKLLEMLQSKGLSVQKIEDNQQEVEHLQTRQLEDDRKIKQLQNTASQNELEMSKVKEENSKLSDELKHSKLQLKQQPSSTHTMQAILEAKDSRISALEKEVQSLEDRLMTLQEEGSIHYDRKDKDAVSSREKTLKAEVDLYKKETSRKDKEVLGLTMKKETLENQQVEHQQYIQLLKEQITAKDQQVVMLQSDLEDLRDRVKDKDSTIDRKAQKSQSLQSEKRKIETEVSDLKEQLEIKDRRISNLQTQIDSLESAVNEKETQLREATTKLESQDSDNKIQVLEESLSEKDKQIDRLKEQKIKSEKEHQEELDVYTKASQDIKTRLDSLQLEFNEKQTELVELRELSTEAQSVKFEADSKIRQLESGLDDKTSEVEKLNVRIEELKGAIPETKTQEELQKQISDLSSQVETARDDANKAQEEVDRLMGINKESENEKNEKENQIKELQEILKEYKQKVGTLKRKQSMEKKNSATMLEEARKREDSLYDDASKLEDHMKSKNDRIEELEEALKESVKITAEREMVMVDLQTQLEDAEKKVDEFTMDLVKSKSDNSGKMEKMTKIMEEKDIKLKKLHAERHKHLEEVFEMKQEAILAAMSEKDANIALLEMTSSKKQNYKEEIEKLNADKEKLQQQLSDVTHNRMKLIQKQERREERKKSSLPRKKRESPVEATESQPEQEQPPMTEQTDS